MNKLGKTRVGLVEEQRNIDCLHVIMQHKLSAGHGCFHSNANLMIIKDGRPKN